MATREGTRTELTVARPEELQTQSSNGIKPKDRGQQAETPGDVDGDSGRRGDELARRRS